MKKRILYFVFAASSIGALNAQQNCNTHSNETISVNEVSANIGNVGNLFEDADGSATGFTTMSGNTSVGLIYSAGLWLGGHDNANNISTSVSKFRNPTIEQDFSPGPIVNGQADCSNWNHLWVVSKTAVRSFLDDINDNGAINSPIDNSILQWPAKGNPYFQNLMGFVLPNQDLAPFFDADADGIYNPYMGDYPAIDQNCNETIPDKLVWAVFNDIATTHTVSGGLPLGVEVQLTAFAFDSQEEYIKRSVFLRHKIIKKTGADLQGVRAGIWADFDLGNYSDDYLGCSSAKNSFYVYNADDYDNTNDVPGFGYIPPVQMITFLNQPLSSFAYSTRSGIGAMGSPVTTEQFYNLLSGKFSDGTSMTVGGNGLNGGGSVTAHAFPDSPTNPLGWSMASGNLVADDMLGVGATDVNTLTVGQEFELLSASTFVRSSSLTLNNFQQVDYALSLTDSLTTFSQDCFYRPFTTQNIVIPAEKTIKLFPNPTSGNVSVHADAEIASVEVYDIIGHKLLTYSVENQKNYELNLRVLSKGLYIVKVETVKGIKEFHKIVLDY